VFGTHNGLIPLYLDMNIEYKSCNTLLFYDALDLGDGNGSFSVNKRLSVSSIGNLEAKISLRSCTLKHATWASCVHVSFVLVGLKIAPKTSEGVAKDYNSHGGHYCDQVLFELWSWCLRNEQIVPCRDCTVSSLYLADAYFAFTVLQNACWVYTFIPT
jgi:hypothetical protein